MVLRREILQLFKYANISVVLRSGFIFAMQSVLTESTTKVYFLGDGGFLGDRKTRTWKCVCGRERYRHRKRRASIIDGIMNGIGGIVGGIFGKPLEVEPRENIGRHTYSVVLNFFVERTDFTKSLMSTKKQLNIIVNDKQRT